MLFLKTECFHVVVAIATSSKALVQLRPWRQPRRRNHVFLKRWKVTVVNGQTSTTTSHLKTGVHCRWTPTTTVVERIFCSSVPSSSYSFILFSFTIIFLTNLFVVFTKSVLFFSIHSYIWDMRVSVTPTNLGFFDTVSFLAN